MEGFALIMKLGVFPGGLLSLDLKEMVKHDFISDDWKDALTSLFTKETEQSLKLKVYSVSDSVTADRRRLRTPVRRSTLQLIDSLQISTGDFFWIQINKILSLNGVLLKPTEAVIEFLMREFQKEIQEFELTRLNYLTLLSLSFLRKIENLSIYHEKILENSAVCKHGLWAIAEDNSFYQKFIKEKAIMVSYLDNSSIKTAKDIQNIYNIHESNFLSSLRLTFIKLMIANTGILTFC